MSKSPILAPTWRAFATLRWRASVTRDPSYGRAFLTRAFSLLCTSKTPVLAVCILLPSYWRAFLTRACALYLLLTLTGCQTTTWTDLHLHTLQNEPVELINFAQSQTVFIFLSPECPLCQNYSVKINKLIQQHRSDSLHFVGVVSGTFYPNEQIRRYLIRYEMELPLLLDPEFKLAKALGAEITPEAFYTAPGGKVLYEGAIDDWAISLGQKRINVQNDYLHDAIVAYQNRSPIDPKKTKAVGCFIE